MSKDTTYPIASKSRRIHGQVLLQAAHSGSQKRDSFSPLYKHALDLTAH